MEKQHRGAAYHGVGACTGVAIGRVYYYDNILPHAEYRESDPKTELVRLEQATAKTGEQLTELYETADQIVGSSGADIFAAHLAISRDKGYHRRVAARITEERANAEYAVSRVTEDYALMFEQMDDAYMRERASDMRAVGGRILENLSGSVRKAIALTEPVILLADDLTPGDTIRMDHKNILGFVTEKGGMNSHTAILARALGIPAIVGVRLPHAAKQDSHGKRACLDGFTGDFLLEPDAYTIGRLREKQAEWRGMQRKLSPAMTEGMQLYANTASAEEVTYAARFAIDGIGLFRTEFLYMGRNAAPDEEEQFACYKSAVEVMGGKPVTFRLADLGGDKSEPYLGIQQEANPAMGMRGVRYLLSHPRLLQTQLRALCRASAYGNVKLMIPMVTSPEEMAAVRVWVDRVRLELSGAGVPMAEQIPIGAMIETPAAALNAAELCKYADFFSLGTNDLTQYTLAADRQTVFASEHGNDTETAAWELALCNPRHPAVCKLIEMAAAAAKDASIPIGVCGEMASDPQLSAFFRQVGVDYISVSGAILGNFT